jgi:hypothetical protein
MLHDYGITEYFHPLVEDVAGPQWLGNSCQGWVGWEGQERND